MSRSHILRRVAAASAAALLALIGVATSATASEPLQTVAGHIAPVELDTPGVDEHAFVITTTDGEVVPVYVPPSLEDVTPGAEIVARVTNADGDDPAEVVSAQVSAGAVASATQVTVGARGSRL